MSKPQIELRPVRPREGTIASFQVVLTGVRSFDQVTLELHEIKFDGDNAKEDRKLGTIKATAVGLTPYRFSPYPQQNGVVGAVDPKDGKKTPRVALLFPKTDGGAYVQVFDVPVDPIEGKDRETWFFQVKMTAPKETASTKYPVAVVPWMLTVGEKATYDWHAHNDVHFYHGGSEGPPGSPGSLQDIADAIGKAESFIFVADWSFHPYFRIDRGKSGGLGTAGRLLVDAANRDVLVAIHAWTHSKYVADEQNNHLAARIEELAGGALPKTLRWRISERTGQRWSHHQKMVVCDVAGPDGKREVKAFFGGCDLTRGRFDWHQHVIHPDDPLAGDFKKAITRNKPLADDKKFPRAYHDWYNGEFQNAEAEESGGQGDLTAPREPWHDIHASIVGPGAWDVLREFVGRWNNDPNKSAKGSGWEEHEDGSYPTWVSHDVLVVNKKFVSLFDTVKGDDKGKKFVQQNEQPAALKDRPWCAQVYRSIDKDHWDKGSRIMPSVNKETKVGTRTEFEWKLPKDSERSIQDAYINAIGRAEEFIYIETQYFISSGEFWKDTRSNVENTLAKAIVDRIVQKKGQPFHCYIVTPMYPEGDPGALSTQAQRNLEWRTMEYMIGRLSNELGGIPWSKHLSFYFPGVAATPKDGKILSVSGVEMDHVRTVESRALAGLPPAGDVDSPWHPDQHKKPPPKPSRKEMVKHNRRYYVYVHSKMMIVDDLWIIIGSANLNERSLAGGRDTEICVGMWPAYPAVRDDCKKVIKDFREHLFEEHFGPAGKGDPKDISGAVQHAARENYTCYRNCVPMPSGHAMLLPLTISGNSLSVTPMPVPEWSNDYLPDSPERSEVWQWDVGSVWRFNRMYLQLIVE
jgi:phosphatidylserine/phosphatidylglycerophosphate/cardiolipin synthase-like enzyme